MRRLRNSLFALLVGISAPLLIWVGAGSALYTSRKQAKLLKQALPVLVCSLDSDCPPGFACLNGRCISATAR